jgi:hypothetical protein
VRHGPGTGDTRPDQLSARRRRLVLAICCLSLFIVGLDSTIVNVALPSIQRDLHAPVSGLQWTIDAYTLVLASFLILSGSIGDRVGRRRVFQTGLVLFTLGSLLCSLAPELGWLVAFRVLQAIGGSMLNPVALSIISNTFTDPHSTDLSVLLHRGEHVTKAHQHLAALVEELLAEAARSGDVRDDVAPGELASYCLHALGAASDLASEAAVRRLVTVTLAGLRPR